MTAGLSFVHRWEPGLNPSPTLLLLHGTGGSENDLMALGRSLWPGANLLSPRGQVRENGMARFFRRLAEGVFDLDDLKTRTADLAGFVEQAAQAYRFDPGRVIAVGYSNGANIAASLLLSGFTTFAGALLFHPMVPFIPDLLPELTGVPVFVAAGHQDPMVPEKLTQQLVELLTAGGATVETQWQPGGHQLNHTEVEAGRKWIQKGDHPWN